MNSDTLSIIDYGVGNIASVINMVKHVGGKTNIISTPADLANAKKLILPGIGHFDNGMECLHKNHWVESLNRAVLENKLPILGICLGMQLMCNSSEEGILSGLCWIDAQVKRFNFNKEIDNFKVPHMGWNNVNIVRNNSLISAELKNQRFYFVHSYHVECNHKKDVILTAEYGKVFVAGFSRENIYGVQFHPEKSHRFGMQLIKNFLDA